MNWAHLKTFVWLRWRLAVNQIGRSGSVGAIISTILTVLMVAGGAIALIIGFVVGFFALATGSSRAVMVVWDGAVVGFVLFWMIGLISELQRSDSLSFDRLLHLPVSPTGAFVINYVGSSVGLSLILFLPAMTGLAVGLVLSRGPWMLLLFPLIAAFFLMATAVTYQFRGWLASMMQNPRRRRTIVAAVPVLFILAFQLPNIWNNLGPGARERRAARIERRLAITKLDQDLAAGRITQAEYDARRPARPGRGADDGYEVARVVNMVVPPGWLPYGAAAAVDGRAWPALAGMFGMGLIGALSLGRAYRTTIRMYKGDFDRGRRRARPVIPLVSSGPRGRSGRSAGFLEWRLPWISEGVSAVAVSGFRSWMRAPEMKMILLTPVIMLMVFTGMFAGQTGASYELMRPLTTSGLLAFLLVIGMVGPVGNQFGFDRAGFRAFVLSPIPRRDLLMGKNLALLPMAMVMMAVGVGLSQWFKPMRLDHLVAVLIQTVAMYLVFCLAGNLMSILGPMPLKPGSGMPAGHQGIRGLFPIAFMLVIPLPLGLTLMPLGIEALLAALGWFTWFPAYLVCGVIQVVAVVWLYRVALDWEGSLLQRREQRILEIVGSRAE